MFALIHSILGTGTRNEIRGVLDITRTLEQRWRNQRIQRSRISSACFKQDRGNSLSELNCKQWAPRWGFNSCRSPVENSKINRSVSRHSHRRNWFQIVQLGDLRMVFSELLEKFRQQFENSASKSISSYVCSSWNGKKWRPRQTIGSYSSRSTRGVERARLHPNPNPNLLPPFRSLGISGWALIKLLGFRMGAYSKVGG